MFWTVWYPPDMGKVLLKTWRQLSALFFSKAQGQELPVGWPWTVWILEMLHRTHHSRPGPEQRRHSSSFCRSSEDLQRWHQPKTFPDFPQPQKLKGTRWLPWWSSGLKIYPAMQRTWVWSLIRKQRSHMPWATRPVCHNYRACSPPLESPCTAVKDPAWYNEDSKCCN